VKARMPRLVVATNGSPRWWGTLSAALIAALLVLEAGVAQAQTTDAPAIPYGKGLHNVQAKEPAAAQPQAKVPIPPAEQMAILIQTSVVALSQANLTGNYSVLHALGAPGFQQSNPPEKLAEIFKKLRESNVDLTPVILFSPNLVRDPVINEQGMLYLVGYYKTVPQQVNFEVVFQPVQGHWRLFGISVNTSPAATAAAQPKPESPPAAAGATEPTKKKK